MPYLLRPVTPSRYIGIRGVGTGLGSDIEYGVLIWELAMGLYFIEEEAV